MENSLKTREFSNPTDDEWWHHWHVSQSHPPSFTWCEIKLELQCLGLVQFFQDIRMQLARSNRVGSRVTALDFSPRNKARILRPHPNTWMRFPSMRGFHSSTFCPFFLIVHKFLTAVSPHPQQPSGQGQQFSWVAGDAGTLRSFLRFVFPSHAREPDGTHLKKYTKDITALASEGLAFASWDICLLDAGKIDPVIGRHEEIRRTVQVLSRRTKNNPVLIGTCMSYRSSHFDCRWAWCW